MSPTPLDTNSHTPGSPLDSATIVVNAICTVLNIVLVNVGLPIPTETLVSVGLAVQGIVVHLARARKGGGGAVRRWF